MAPPPCERPKTLDEFRQRFREHGLNLHPWLDILAVQQRTKEVQVKMDVSHNLPCPICGGQWPQKLLYASVGHEWLCFFCYYRLEEAFVNDGAH